MKKTLSLGLLMAMVLLLAMAAGPVFGGNGNDVEKAKKAQDKVNQKVLSKKDVVGTAVGRNAEGEVVVRVFTAKSGVGGIPKEQDGVKVVAQVTGPILAISQLSAPVLSPSAYTTTDKWPRPVPIGVSTGHPAITAGTIGARVTKGSNVYALSNNHVYADENQASIGDAVIQPGTFDGGSSPADDIGNLYAFKPIVFTTSANNTIDAAIALSSTGNLDNATPSGGYGTPSSTIVSASLGQKVQKYGRTTELTKGEITGINATLNIGYGTGTARFVNQIIVETRKPGFIKGGDSGSLLVIQGGAHDGKPVGLLFAGTSTGRMAVANRIDLVLGAFAVTIDGEYEGSPDPTNTPIPDTPTPTPTPSDPPTPTPTPSDPPTPTPTATPTPPGSENMGVYEISWRSKKKNLDFTVYIRRDSDASGSLTSADSPVEAAHVNATLTHDTDGDGIFECGTHDECWTNFGGDTKSNGGIKFSLVGGAPSGSYQAVVTGLTHATFTWDKGLDVGNFSSFGR